MDSICTGREEISRLGLYSQVRGRETIAETDECLLGYFLD